MELANRLDRLWATLIDTLLFVPLGIGVGLVSVSKQSPGLTATMSILLLVVLILVPLIYQAWLLTTRGQTLGKKVLKIRIVKASDQSNGGFVTNVLMRSVLSGAIRLVPIVGTIFSIADILFIFRADRRCLHDHIAGTCVVAGNPVVQ
ncbi:MAG: RDD family protein [Elusimicrobiota bacterium]